MSAHHVDQARNRSRERGIALVVTLLALCLILVLGLGVLQSSIAALRTAGNDRSSKAALAIAEAGAEFARETLRVQLRGGSTLDQALARAANGGSLVMATAISGFNGSTSTDNRTSNRPLITPSAFANGNFQVFLTNDREEPGAANAAASVRLMTDSNRRVMITSFGTTAGGAMSVVQEQLRMYDLFMPGPNLPAAIVLPGPTVNFSSFNSNARQVSGIDNAGNGCFPTVSVSSNAAKAVVDDEIKKRPNYQSCPPFTGYATQNFLPTALNPYDPVSANTPLLAGNPDLTKVKNLQKLVDEVKAVADFRSASDPGFSLGSPANPKIVAVDGDLEIKGNPSGAGILLVTGKLTFSGTPTYDGVILVVGAGDFLGNGNGNGKIHGAMLVANTKVPWATNPEYVGVPTYRDNGGGNSEVRYDSDSLSRYAAAIMPLELLTFQQLR